VASLLLQNQKYQEAMNWLQYIFNPTDNSSGPVPQRFWETAPFNVMNATDWVNQEIQALLSALAVDARQGISDPATQNAILAWMADPFDPHMVASTRISAYARATVMRFLDNLIAWGDLLYAQYTSETVGQAEQLYILADMILGPRPDRVRPPAVKPGALPTYAALSGLDLFSNILVNIENIVVAPEPPQSLVEGAAQTSPLPQLPGTVGTTLFGIPPNGQLLAYWDKVEQRLYNIRHCLNLQGKAQPLPLYAPPLNPLQLIAGQAAGAGAAGVVSSAPIYRFATYLQKAIELTNDVRAYGALILSALEKRDAETLSVLRATQEVDAPCDTVPMCRRSARHVGAIIVSCQHSPRTLSPPAPRSDPMPPPDRRSAGRCGRRASKPSSGDRGRWPIYVSPCRWRLRDRRHREWSIHT
jgi:hypothetical protein